ncbi:hypothetical protein [Halomonas eurihalina]|uniref:hypothetical protein n=1 Tax=Halomonas eurihalina TaxID=42566 RepID=UPI001659DC33|nr:hypothetical protein [Halomonas eurihalina]MDR5861325.1 hypothetical protein [Halomonas eurihalina]
MMRQVVFRPIHPLPGVNVTHRPDKPCRDTRLRNRVFFTTVAIAVVVGLWLAR